MTPDPHPMNPAATARDDVRRDAASPALAEALARLRADLGEQHAPAALWPRIAASAPAPAAAEAGRVGMQATPLPAIAWPRWAGGAAAALAIALVWWAGPGRIVRLGIDAPAPTAGEGAAALALAGQASGFVPVASPERFAELWRGGAEAAPAWVVRTELPRERLAALGLPYDPARAGERVRAELLLHPSGDVLAVRLTR